MPTDTQALLDALDRLRGTGVEFDGVLANHGPMAAEAMIRLGASDRVPAWVDAYRRRLTDAPPPGNEVTADNWPDNLGDLRRIGDWTAWLVTLAQETDWRSLLALWWPRLLPGAAASATHGLIRTAHAVRALADSDHDAAANEVLKVELAHGLAFWAARYQPIPGRPTLTGSSHAIDAIAALPRLSPGVPSVGPGVAGRLAALVELRELPDALDAYGCSDGEEQALDELISAAARVVAARPDAPIAYCHAVTAPAAVQMVLPHLPPNQRRASVAVSWQIIGGLIAAYAAPRMASESQRFDTDPEPMLSELAPRAVEHGDEHVIKLTEAALRQYARTGDTTLLVAATNFRERIKPA